MTKNFERHLTSSSALKLSILIALTWSCDLQHPIRLRYFSID